MDENDTPVSRPTPVILFTIVAVILIAALLLGLFFGKRYIASLNSPAKVATSPKNAPSKNPVNKKSSQDKAAEQRIAEQKAQEKKRQQAKKEQTKKDNAADSSASSSPNASPAPATSRPNNVVATGPTETLASLLGIIALGFAGKHYLASRRQTS